MTIQLHIPDNLANKIKAVTGNAEKYILDHLRSKVNGLAKPLLLADEYRLAASENAQVMSDFSHVDMEGWSDEY